MSSGADELNTAVFLKSGSDQGLVREGVLVILESLAQVGCNVNTDLRERCVVALYSQSGSESLFII